MNADDTEVLTSSLDVPNQDKNLFAYCDNDPVNRVDYGGDRWSWGTVFGMSTLKQLQLQL